MKRFRVLFPVLAVFLFAIVLIGCGSNSTSSGGGSSTDTTAPTVISTNPDNAATGVAMNMNITATFSEAMDTTTITFETFTLSNETTGSRVTCEVTYTGVIATLTPVATLDATTTYEAIITTGAKDISGNALTANKIWHFTTSATLDTTAPTVLYTDPVSGESSVGVNSNIFITFNEEMKATTITTREITLKQGATLFPCTVGLVGAVATLNPTGDLAAGTVYTVTISTDATDLAGNHLAAVKVITFTTLSTGTASVSLGTAANYTILANVIVNTAPSTVEGNIGGDSAGASVTGFTLTVNGAGTYATSDAVSGLVYKMDYASPTPVNLSAAVTDEFAAYNDAATRTPTSVEGTSMDIGGKTLIPGVHNWSGDVTMSSDIILTGDANAVWIFQIGGYFSPTALFSVQLLGGATANHVFWQVGDYVTLGTGTHVEGIILATNAVNFGAGSSVKGRVFSKTATVNLVTSRVTLP